MEIDKLKKPELVELSKKLGLEIEESETKPVFIEGIEKLDSKDKDEIIKSFFDSIEEEVKPAEQKLKAKYKVQVIGFYALGKMFRSGEEITLKEYSKQIPEWEKLGYIK